MHSDYSDAIMSGLAILGISLIAAIFMVWFAVVALFFVAPTWLQWAGWVSIAWWALILGFIAWRWVSP